MFQILIVEDDRDLNHAYSVILESQGYRVETAFNGQEALEKVKTFAPDLILLDLLMPVMGGLEFLEHYNPAKKHRDVQVLIFTNMESSAEVAAAYKLGAKRCIVKSWTAPHNLARVVADTLHSKDAQPTV